MDGRLASHGHSFRRASRVVDAHAPPKYRFSLARRRVRGAAPVPDADLTAEWEVVEAFLAAARDGDFDALVAVLDPDVVLRADGGLTYRPLG
jgi:RNA polymerase sigma-70 factor (ECF subfamily)